jgi:hypothetical protein
MAIATLVACNDYETYSEQKEKERNGIRKFISDRGFTEISEEKFHSQNNTTNSNEFVYLNNSGVYMNIVRKGAGTPLQDGENTELYFRFSETNILDTAKYVTNTPTLPYDPDVMSISRSGSNFTASFTSGVMYSTYGASVPTGWLVPFNYINVGSPNSTENISYVRLIVPHTQGHTVASGNVYPYYYEIRFQRSPGL